MLSEKQRIFNWLYRHEFPAGVLEFDEILLDAAEGALRKTRIDAESFAYNNTVKYWNWLLQRQQEDTVRGITPLFQVKDTSVRRISWYPISDHHSLTSKQKYRISLVRHRPSILRKIDALSDRQYEALSCAISRLFGAERILLTPSGNEGGIDFFAVLTLRNTTHPFYGKSGPVRIIGQCKKYSDKVQVDLIKEFIETLDEVKQQSLSVEKSVPPWFRAAKGPVIGWIIAHNGFQDGAETKARHHGIVYSDSLDLAEIAVSSRKLMSADTMICSQRLEESVSAVLKEFNTRT